jgi:hypothetical protein
MRKSFAALALGGLLSGACAGPQYFVETAPTVTVPLAEQTLGVRSVAPGETVLEAPVGYMLAAKLEADAVVSIIGREFAFASEETLPLGRIGGRAASSLPEGGLAFCGLPNSNLAKNMLAASTLGVTTLLNRTGAETRVCFVDKERDNFAESALLVGAKSDADAAPVPIAPLAYRLATAEPMSGESVMRISYSGKTGMVGGHVSFDLAVREQGRPLYFDNRRRKVNIRELPQKVSLMGAEFTVLSYDPVTGSAEIDVHQAIPRASYGVQSSYTTQSIPIYVPR